MATLYLAQPDALLWYEDLPGIGPPLVCLHGLVGACSAQFIGIARHPLLVGQRMILVDVLGHGYSERPADWTYSMEDHATTVAALLDHLGVGGCAILGHSMGGSIAIALAAARPELVARLILAEGVVNPSADPFGPGTAAPTEEEYCREGGGATVAQMRAAGLAGSAEWAAVFAPAQHADFRAAYRCFVDGNRDRQPSFRERLEALPIPRANIYGARTLEDPVRKTWAQGMRDSGIPLLVVPNAGHVMMADNLDGFAEAIHAALQLD